MTLVCCVVLGKRVLGMSFIGVGGDLLKYCCIVGGVGMYKGCHNLINDGKESGILGSFRVERWRGDCMLNFG